MQVVATLKEQILNNKRFEDTWNYFYDHCAENDEFFELGKRVDHGNLKIILQVIGREFVKNKKAEASGFTIIAIKEHQFYHGSFFIDQRLCNFIFFEDIDVGMAIIAKSLHAKDVMFSRFSVTSVLSGAEALAKKSMN